MKHLFMLVILTGVFFTVSAQQREVRGIVADSAGNSIIAATVKLAASKDTLWTRSDADGKFVFKNVPAAAFSVSVNSLGYKPFSQHFTFKEGSPVINLDPITLKIEAKELEAVVVDGTPAVTIKEDTVEYRASDFPVRENSVVEDVVKKLPGVEVDKDGNITAQGKPITKVRVNGKDFFNGDVKTATQQLPAEIIEKLQVIDDYGDQANISGIKGDQEPEKILNIQIRPDRNKGVFGRAAAGAGNENRYQLSGIGNYYNNDQQIAFMGNFNNTNASMFDFARSGRRGREGGIGGGGDGITNVTSVGANYRDELSKKVSINGSYSFSVRDNNSLSQSFVQTEVAHNNTTSTLFNNVNADSNNWHNNHRFNFTLEYRPDSVNYFRFDPTVRYASSNSSNYSASQQTGFYKQDQVTNNSGSSNSPTLSGRILYNHRFASKPGRNLSMDLDIDHDNNRRNSDVDNRTSYYENPNDADPAADSILHRIIDTDNESMNVTASADYSEPLGLYSRLELSYEYDRVKYDNSRITNVMNTLGTMRQIDSLSNIYNYSFTTNRFRLSYRYNNKNYNYSLGLTAQPSLLEGESLSRNTTTKRSAFNWIPVAQFTYKFARTRELQFRYSGRSSEPSFSQIQPVRDVTNPQRPIVGNPDLKAAFNHSVRLRYNNSDPATGKTLFTGITADLIQDRIVSNVVLIPDTLGSRKQETRYLNADGYYSIRGYYYWGQSFADKKYRLSYNGSVSYNNNISYADDLENIGRNWVLSQRLRLQVNPKEWLELYPAVGYTYNWNSYTLRSNNNSKINSWSFDLNGRVYFLNTLNIGFDASKNLNRGYSGIDNNPLIINAFLEKQFTKSRRTTLRLQAFDLLNEGTNISRSITDNSIRDSQTNRLTQYFMLTFTMRLQKFAGGQQNRVNFGDRRREEGRESRGEGHGEGRGGMRGPGSRD